MDISQVFSQSDLLDGYGQNDKVYISDPLGYPEDPDHFGYPEDPDH